METLRRGSIFVASCVLLACATSAVGQTFVDARRDGLLASMPPPPSDGSLAGRADLEAVLLIQQTRTPDQERAAEADADVGSVAWAMQALGPGYSPETHPRHFALFERARADMTRVVDVIKAEGPQRPRPASRDARVRPSLSVAGHGANSWPSGRAAATRAWAGILADIFPERAEAVQAKARISAAHRIIGGVHYPTDVVAGDDLADAFLLRLRANRAYREELSELTSASRR